MLARCRLIGVVLCAGTAVGCFEPPCGHFDRADFRVECPTYVEQPVPLKMTIVVPDASSPRPAVLLLHGGAWYLGQRRDMENLATSLALLGYVSATADYRLASDGHHYPAPVLDAMAAVKFLRARAADYGIDPDRIAIAGESAGGHLALLVAYTAGQGVFENPHDPYPDVSAEVQAVISLYGPADLAGLYRDTSRPLARLGLKVFMDGDPTSAPDRYAQGSPVTHIRPDLPPTLIVHGTADTLVPYAQSEMLYSKLRAANVPCRLSFLPRVPHPLKPMYQYNLGIRHLPAIVQFLAQVFPEPVAR